MEAPPHMPISAQADADLLSHELFLSALVQEVTRVMLSADNLPRTLHTFLLGIREIAGQRRSVIFKLVGSRLVTETHSGAGLRKRLKGFSPESRLNPIANCLREGFHLLVERPKADDPFLGLAEGGAYLLVPLTVDHAGMGLAESKRGLGLLWLDAGDSAPPLTGQGLSHILSLAQLAALRMENFRFHRELEHANQRLQRANGKLELANHRLNLAQRRMDEDLNRARSIQAALLPSLLPQGKFQALAARYIPAGKVGGDYWDCFELPGNRLGMVVADVSGHGISAALVMTMFKVLLKSFATTCDSPAEVLKQINRTFLQEISGGRHFVTAFYAVYDLNSRRMVWTNAGHLAQIALLPMVAEGSATSIEHPKNVESWDNAMPVAEMNSLGLVLGVFDQTMLTDRYLDLPQGSRLVLFTDGIIEAHNPEGKMFGPQRMLRLALAEQGRGAEDLASLIMQEWRNHQGALAKGAAPDESADDATLVILDL